VQGYLLAYPVEAVAAEAEAQAATARARNILDAASKMPRSDAAPAPLVFVGTSGRKRSS
jgi:hypothetical protein